MLFATGFILTLLAFMLLAVVVVSRGTHPPNKEK